MSWIGETKNVVFNFHIERTRPDGTVVHEPIGTEAPGKLKVSAEAVVDEWLSKLGRRARSDKKPVIIHETCTGSPGPRTGQSVGKRVSEEGTSGTCGAEQNGEDTHASD